MSELITSLDEVKLNLEWTNDTMKRMIDTDDVNVKTECCEEMIDDLTYLDKAIKLYLLYLKAEIQL